MMANDHTRKRQAPVFASACPDYRPETVKKAFDALLEEQDLLAAVKPGMKVAVKVNLVSAKAPEAAATTHPELVCELCRRLAARGAFVTVGDSPGGLFTKEVLEHVYRASGMTRVEETGAKLNFDVSTEDVNFDKAVSAHVFTCTAWLKSADLIINFAKLKTHGMMRLTASVKNMFGAVPGTTKPEYHMRFPEESAFAGMLIDLNEYFRPALNIVDAVTGMEGNGPTAGTPRNVGLLLASESPYDLDMVCADTIGLRVQDVPTLSCAARRGLGPTDVTEVRILGTDTKAYRVPDFREAAGRSMMFFGGSPLGRLTGSVLVKALQQVPKVAPSECISCGKCFRVCPAHAITMRGAKAAGAANAAGRQTPGEKAAGKDAPGRKTIGWQAPGAGGVPHIDRNKCIRCFCCQEFCPVGAMKVHRTAIARLLQRKEE